MKAEMSKQSPTGSLEFASGRDIRMACRDGSLSVTTTGLGHGFVQGNLAILPSDIANDFLRFCQANPRPCPIIGVSDVGSPKIPSLGTDLDIRTDLPSYRVWKDGEQIDEIKDISSYWRDDLVSFVLGCSLSFEGALIDEGIPLRHYERSLRVPMFRTNISCQPAGPFAGPMVVSMRPLKAAQAIRAIQITSRFPAVHGAPVHIGDPRLIGIEDVMQPDYGDAVEVMDDEIPVFWACGVTPQSVIANIKPAFAITHSPGCMLVTDRKNNEFAVI